MNDISSILGISYIDHDRRHGQAQSASPQKEGNNVEHYPCVEPADSTAAHGRRKWAEWPQKAGWR
jgi:hypothetical protein